MSIHILLVGESWVTTSTHYKGFDFFSSTTYALGSDALVAALQQAGVRVTHQPSHIAAREFPLVLEELLGFDAIILSDIGANTLLLHPDVFLAGKRIPNRLKLIKEYVREGKGLIMAGGYLSFQGIYGSARYKRTPIAEVLPVELLELDDRVEAPEGVEPRVSGVKHPITENLEATWPFLLGFNELRAKPEGEVLATVGEYPLLVAGSFGTGRSVAWASDVGPHWCPQEFVDWPGYARLWTQIVEWVSGERR